MDLDLGDTRLIIAEARKRGVLRNQLAYMLATAKWETAHTMKPVREAFFLKAKYGWSEERLNQWRAKNLSRYYPWDARGYVGLTWQRNYIRAGKRLDVDLTTDPDRAMDPQYAVPILIVGCMEGWFTGKKIPDYITLRKSDFVGAREVVNRRDRAHEIAAIARKYDAALLAEGYGVDAPLPPAVEPIAHDDPMEQPGGMVARIIAAIVQMLRAMAGGK